MFSVSLGAQHALPQCDVAPMRQVTSTSRSLATITAEWSFLYNAFRMHRCQLHVMLLHTERLHK